MANTRRGRGENGLFFSPEKNAWIGRIELPSHDGRRRRKEIQRKSKADLIRELTRLQKQLEPEQRESVEVFEDLRAVDALEVIRLQDEEARFRIEVSRPPA